MAALLSLRASDLLLTPERIREALAALGEAEADVDEMPHGGIIWRAEHDKIGHVHVTPMHPTTRLRHLPDIDAARARGWKTPQAIKLSYAQAEAAGIRRAIESA